MSCFRWFNSIRRLAADGSNEMRAMHHARSVLTFLFIFAEMVSFLPLWLLSAAAFGVSVKGCFAALSVGTLLYVSAAAAMGFLISTFTRT